MPEPPGAMELPAAEAVAEAAVDAAGARANPARRHADAFSLVDRRLFAGELQRAVLECDRVAEAWASDREIVERANKLKSWIPRLGRALDEGHRLYSQGNFEGAVAPLRDARELYRKIGFEGATGDHLDEQLAVATLRAAREALGRNDLSAAAEHYRQAMSLKPSDPRAGQGLEFVHQKAEEVFRKALGDRERAPQLAAEQFQVVLDVLPRTAETWGRAKMNLEEIRMGDRD
jgi:tetratricopeptide (TPR) repeat protein